MTKENKELKVSKNKASTSKKISTSKNISKNSTTKKIDTKCRNTNNKNTISEYYDLPQNYNKTIVKVLAQTPNILFIYWEISNEDIMNYKKQYGADFFQTTKPVLIVHNNTLNYSFEVDINDYANNWYLHVNNSNSNYEIELGRRAIVSSKNPEAIYIPIASSNKIQSPNDHILFNNSEKMVYFKNVKTNVEVTKNSAHITFIKNMGKVYDIFEDSYVNGFAQSSQFK